MDEGRVDCLAYPVIRRIAPEIGGRQLGHNSALAAQAGFPAIAVPAGFTPSGFPVGVELLGRTFAEPTLLGLAFSFEQATMHRRPPVTTPSLSRHSEAHAEPLAVAEVGSSALRTVVTATGAGSLPASDVPFAATIRLRFDAGTRILDFDGELSGPAGHVAGVFLHRCLNRRNGGVAYQLAKGDAPVIRGQVRLQEDESADLRDGKFYVSVINRTDPRQSARGDIVSWD